MEKVAVTTCIAIFVCTRLNTAYITFFSRCDDTKAPSNFQQELRAN